MGIAILFPGFEARNDILCSEEQLQYDYDEGDKIFQATIRGT